VASWSRIQERARNGLAPIRTIDRTASAEILVNVGDFEAHVRAGDRSPMTAKAHSQAVQPSAGAANRYRSLQQWTAPSSLLHTPGCTGPNLAALGVADLDLWPDR